MKKLVSIKLVLILISFTGLLNAQQLSLNFESGDRNIEIGNCWSFGAFTYVNYNTLTANLALSGNWGGRSNQLTNPDLGACWIKTPWMLPGSGDITFITRLAAANGTTRGIRLSYIPYDPSSASASKEGVPVVFYSWDWPSINLDIYTITANVPAAIANSGQPYKIRVSFVGTGGNSRALVDDMVFPGQYWSDPSNGCLPMSVIVDTDGDGVDDEDDDYPTDPYRAFNNYYPSASSYATLAFEDNWPNKGDYDFNDVVVNYRLNRVTNAQNQIVEVLGTFVLKASGASFKNGFGFQLNGITPDKVISVNGTNLGTSTYIDKLANGLEASQSFANVIVFDNFYDIMQHPGVGTGINTDPNAPFVPYQVLNVNVQFINNGSPAAGGPILITELPISAFNFYIISNQDRGREIHLADYLPTDLANPAYFNSGQDDTQPGQGKYYKTSNNLPWGLSLREGFEYPIEKVSVDKAYLHFVEWAESSGTLYPDWSDNTPGYRDNTKIYQPPAPN
jgi:LruC domain-containing protein